MPLITEYDALRFFFDFFPLKLTSKDYTDSTSMLAVKYKNHFAQLSQKMGYQIKPDEAEINFLAYEILKQKHYKKAGSLFKLNVDNYPESFNVLILMSIILWPLVLKPMRLFRLKRLWH